METTVSCGATGCIYHDKKASWYAVLEDPRMAVTSTLLDQAHSAIERKWFAMKGPIIQAGANRHF